MKTYFQFSLSAIFIVIILLSGCTGKRPNTQNDSETVAVTDQIDTHNSRNSLDYEGTYTGTLPCADCEGIYMELTLSGDTYTIKSAYQGKEDKGENTFTESGIYAWDNTGSIIILNDNNQSRYQVGENVLYALDANGKHPTGNLEDMYILKKKQ